MNFYKIRYIFYYFKLNITRQHYIEFIIDDSKNKIAYSKLVYGDYDWVFAYNHEKFLYKIALGNGCSSDKRFNCLTSSKIQCVRSQTDCGCPDEYYKCNYTLYRIPENKKDIFSDVEIPNQKVCPIEKVLCAYLMNMIIVQYLILAASFHQIDVQIVVNIILIIQIQLIAEI